MPSRNQASGSRAPQPLSHHSFICSVRSYNHKEPWLLHLSPSDFLRNSFYVLAYLLQCYVFSLEISLLHTGMATLPKERLSTSRHRVLETLTKTCEPGSQMGRRSLTYAPQANDADGAL